MKKLLSAILAVSLIYSGISALAAPSPSPSAASRSSASPAPSAIPETSTSPNASATPEVSSAPSASATPNTSPSPSATPIRAAKDTSEEFIVDLYMQKHRFTLANDIVLELYSANGEKLGSQKVHYDWNTEKLTLTYKVPRYVMGEKFKIRLISGLRSIQNYDKWVHEGGELEIQTYGYIDENNQYVQNNGCSLSANPHYEKELCIYVDNKFYKDMAPSARIVDGIAMAPVRALGDAIGLKVTYDQAYDSVVCSVEDKQVIFNANSAYTNIFGKDTFTPHATVYIEGSLFVPVRTLSEAFGANIEVLDFDDHLDIIISASPIVQEFRAKTPVNKNGIDSRTGYLVWVDKSEYTVHVYEGKKYQWNELRSFPCALGAWDTPTITGQFEYIERTQWDYGTYYVGPVLRFHNGYALHSTLLYYGGGEYDGRVGVNISHGCVRLHPQDINWIADTIPFRTRIYITE